VEIIETLLVDIKFHWERFTQPAVIAGMCVMALGLIMSFCSKPIANAIARKRKSKGEAENTDMVFLAFKYISVGIVFLGMLFAIIMMQK